MYIGACCCLMLHCKYLEKKVEDVGYEMEGKGKEKKESDQWFLIGERALLLPSRVLQ